VKYYHLMVGAQGQVKWAKVAWKSSTYDFFAQYFFGI